LALTRLTVVNDTHAHTVSHAAWGRQPRRSRASATSRRSHGASRHGFAANLRDLPSPAFLAHL